MVFLKDGIIGDVKGSLLTGKVISTGFTKAYFAVAIFIDLQDPEDMAVLEPELLKVLNGDLPEYDAVQELYSLHADKNETVIDVNMPVFSDKERHSKLPTITLYHLVCRYNVFDSIIKSVERGEKPVVFQEEYDRRMNLVKGYDGNWACMKNKIGESPVKG